MTIGGTAGKLAALLFGLGSVAQAFAAEARNAGDLRAELEPGWNEIRPGGDTICSLGSAFAFFARAAAPDRLLIYFEGGGACWDAATCDPQGDPTYKRIVDENDNPANQPTGIFALDEAANPVRDWSMVFVPYCTGDVHLGDALTHYTVREDDGTERTFAVHHRGYRNARAALAWTFERWEAPAQVLVAGSSAGSIPSPFYAQLLAERYPEARVISMADSAGAYRRDPEGANPAEPWAMLDVLQRQRGFEDFTTETIDFRHLPIVAARTRPDLLLLQFDTANDTAQQFYSDLVRTDDRPVQTLLRRNLAAIRAAAPRFRSFVAGGAEHTILWRPTFYDYEVDDVLFRDWFADALAGTIPEDRSCEDCQRPELRLTATERRVFELATGRLAAGWSPTPVERCPAADEPTTLRCALLEATGEVAGAVDPGSPALLEARFEAWSRLGDAVGPREDPLQVFNARAAGRETILAFLATLTERAPSPAMD